MKLFAVTCPHCGGKLEVTSNSKMVTCEYCNCDFMIDDEVTPLCNSNIIVTLG